MHKQIIDLTHTVINTMPVHQYDQPPQLEKFKSLEKDSYNDWQLTSGMHVGTHIDGPGHLTNSTQLLSEYPIERFVNKGFLIDARGTKTIDAPLLANCPQQKNLTVLVLTGYDKIFGTPKYYNDHPIITEAFAQKLVALEVSMLGIDFFSPDTYPFPIHQVLFKHDILIIENLTRLENLIGIQNFTIAALPLKTETDSALARVVAIIE